MLYNFPVMNRLIGICAVLCLLIFAACEKDSSSPDTKGYLTGNITIDGEGIDGVIIEVSGFHISGGSLAKAALESSNSTAGDYTIRLEAGTYRADYIYYGGGNEQIRTARYPIEIRADDITVVDVELKDPVPHSVLAIDGNASVEISWESSYGVAGYYIYRADSNGVEFQRIAEAEQASGTINYSDQPSRVGIYYYYVTSYNSEQDESDHEGIKEVEFTASIRSPSGLTAVDMVEYISLSWNENDRAEYYKIYRMRNTGGVWDVIDSTSQTEINDSPPDTGLYRYYVTAVSNYGTESVPSTAVSVLYDGRFDPPQNLSISDQGSSLYLSWVHYENAAYYSIYRTDNPENDFVNIDTTSDPGYSDAPVDTGIYYYYVTATAYNGMESEPSNTVSSYFDGILDYPTGFTAADRGLYVELNWHEVPWAGAYILFRSDDGVIYIQIASIAGTITSYNDTPINAGLYYYRIASETVTGIMGELSDPVDAEFTDNLLPPSNIEAESYGTYIVLSWNTVIGASGYRVYRAISENGSYDYIDSTSATSYIDTPSDEGPYYYKLRSFDEVGHISVFSSSVYVYFDDNPLPPFNISAIDSVYKIALWWESNETAANYLIYRSTSLDGIYLPTQTVSGTAAFEWPSSAGNYFFKLRTIVESDTSEFSEFVHVLFSGILQPPGDLSAYDAGTHIHLEWIEPAGGSYYEVYRSDTVDGEYARIMTVYDNSADDVPDTEGIYFFKIKAFTQGNLPSSFSAIAQVEFTP